jgi:hypothetical protein
MFGMNSAERRVERHLADRNTHSSRPLIAQPQDSLAIADHNALHAVVARVAEDLFDAIFIGITEEQTSGLPPNLAEALAAFPDSRRVDDRKHLFDMAQQQRVEQSFVRILQVAEKAVFIESGRLVAQGLKPAVDLLLESPYMRRQ